MSALPADAAKLYATKGKLFGAAEHVNNYAGKMAFDGDTTMVALYTSERWRTWHLAWIGGLAAAPR